MNQIHANYYNSLLNSALIYKSQKLDKGKINMIYQNLPPV